MKINTEIIKKYIKILLVTIIIFYVIYLLYKFFYKIPESFENNIDCSLCKLSHNNNKCIHLKSLQKTNNNLIEIDSSFIFCPWEPNCTGSSIECCSGNQSEFYSNNFMLDQIHSHIITNQLQICFPEFSNNQYCIDLSLNKNLRGMAFKKELKQQQIFNRPNFTISNELYTYTLNDKNLNDISDTYILNHYQYFDCSGNIKSNNNQIFNQEQLDKFYSNNYFGVASDAEYTTQQDTKNKYNNYSSKKNLKMELKNLLPITDSSNVPVSIINQYLSAINRFYEKQISNMTGPKTHSFNQEMVFDNNTLETKTPTFFVYNNDPNNEYQCQPSITGNPKFKYCGPEPQYMPFQ